MILTYLYLEFTLLNHPKTRKFRQLLDLTKQDAVKYIVCLWIWAGQYAQEGRILEKDLAAAFSEDGAGWAGSVETLRDALVAAELIDQLPDGSFYIHNWKERAVGFWSAQDKFESRKAMDRERQARHREKMARLREDVISKYGADPQRRGLRKPRQKKPLPVLPADTPETPVLDPKKDPNLTSISTPDFETKNDPNLDPVTHVSRDRSRDVTLRHVSPNVTHFGPFLDPMLSTGARERISENINDISASIKSHVSHAPILSLPSKDLKACADAQGASCAHQDCVDFFVKNWEAKKGEVFIKKNVGYVGRIVSELHRPKTEGGHGFEYGEIRRRMARYLLSDWKRVVEKNYAPSLFKDKFNELGAGPLEQFQKPGDQHGTYDKGRELPTRDDFSDEP